MSRKRDMRLTKRPHELGQSIRHAEFFVNEPLRFGLRGAVAKKVLIALHPDAAISHRGSPPRGWDPNVTRQDADECIKSIQA